MKSKKIDLKTWMFLKTIPALLLATYYWMCTREDFKPSYSYIQYAFAGIAGIFVCFQIYYAKKKDIFDEFARENLKTTDSISLKIVYVLFIIISFICVFSDFSGELAGYCIVFSILLLTVLRAVIFSVIDEKGI